MLAFLKVNLRIRCSVKAHVSTTSCCIIGIVHRKLFNPPNLLQQLRKVHLYPEIVKHREKEQSWGNAYEGFLSIPEVINKGSMYVQCIVWCFCRCQRMMKPGKVASTPAMLISAVRTLKTCSGILGTWYTHSLLFVLETQERRSKMESKEKQCLR